MVHLSRVKRGKQAQKPQQEQDQGESAASPYVYGTHYATEELPEHVMSEREMPADVAFRLIKDELSLDGNPLLKCASFSLLMFKAWSDGVLVWRVLLRLIW